MCFCRFVLTAETQASDTVFPHPTVVALLSLLSHFRRLFDSDYLHFFFSLFAVCPIQAVNSKVWRPWGAGRLREPGVRDGLGTLGESTDPQPSGRMGPERSAVNGSSRSARGPCHFAQVRTPFPGTAPHTVRTPTGVPLTLANPTLWTLGFTWLWDEGFLFPGSPKSAPEGRL